MKRPDSARIRRTGFTLVELLIATTLSLMLMGAMVYMVGKVGEGVADSRAMLESADRLRLAQSRLQMDLSGITATVSPSLKPENNEGYFEYVEGPVGVPTPPMISLMQTPDMFAVNTDNGGAVDQTVGDFDDWIGFTTRSKGKPFIGRYYNTATGQIEPIEADVAEVVWFLRGHTLHRRVLLVVPNLTLNSAMTPYYNYNDISAHTRGGVLVPNTLGDLTRRECRFAHPSTGSYDARLWRWNLTSSPATIFPTLPTLQECTSAGWTTERAPPVNPYQQTALDMWTNTVMPENAFITPNTGIRVSDDIILTNVIGFDVKAWDPTAPNGMGGLGAYVDLGYLNKPFLSSTSRLSHLGQPNSQLVGTANYARVYDTWSTTYYGDYWADGLDNGAIGSNGIVDDDAEKTYPPPYPIPLRGIQVKIRVFEPDSKQVREVTVEQDFLPR